MSTVSQSVSSLRTALTTLAPTSRPSTASTRPTSTATTSHTCAQARCTTSTASARTPGTRGTSTATRWRPFVTWAEKYVDDSAWVDALDSRSTKWATAHGHASDAWDDVNSKNLPALDSWKGPAGNAYREVVPEMQAGTSAAYYGALTHEERIGLDLGGGRDLLHRRRGSGRRHWQGSLTHYAAGTAALGGERPALGGARRAPTSCGLLHDTDDAGNHPWTALTTCESALTALESEVDEGAAGRRVAGGPAQGGFVSVPEPTSPTPGRRRPGPAEAGAPPDPGESSGHLTRSPPRAAPDGGRR